MTLTLTLSPPVCSLPTGCFDSLRVFLYCSACQLDFSLEFSPYRFSTRAGRAVELPEVKNNKILEGGNAARCIDYIEHHYCSLDSIRSASDRAELLAFSHWFDGEISGLLRALLWAHQGNFDKFTSTEFYKGIFFPVAWGLRKAAKRQNVVDSIEEFAFESRALKILQALADRLGEKKLFYGENHYPTSLDVNCAALCLFTLNLPLAFNPFKDALEQKFPTLRKHAARMKALLINKEKLNCDEILGEIPRIQFSDLAEPPPARRVPAFRAFRRSDEAEDNMTALQRIRASVKTAEFLFPFSILCLSALMIGFGGKSEAPEEFSVSENSAGAQQS